MLGEKPSVGVAIADAGTDTTVLSEPHGEHRPALVDLGALWLYLGADVAGARSTAMWVLRCIKSANK